MPDIVILSATRTPIGAFQGASRPCPPPKLGAAAIKGAMARAGVAPLMSPTVLMGNVLQAGQGQAPARQAALRPGLPQSGACRDCPQGLRLRPAGRHAGGARVCRRHGLDLCRRRHGEHVAGALSPAQGARRFPLGHQQVIDSLITDGLWDPYNNLHMGSCAEQCAAKYKPSPASSRTPTPSSFKRANAAQKDGQVRRRDHALRVTDAKGNVTKVEHDEGPAKVKYDKIPTLKPAFQKDGTITPANASSINDGAAALVLATADTAKAKGLKPIARLVALAATRRIRCGSPPLPCRPRSGAQGGRVEGFRCRSLGGERGLRRCADGVHGGTRRCAHDKVNVRGGAIALGHPIGASGARILVTLIAALQERGLKRGVAAICIGGGEGLAVCVEIP
jgi:acetyl-CoA C-acetyltransferase